LTGAEEPTTLAAMVVQITPDEFLDVGLVVSGFGGVRQRSETLCFIASKAITL
jgi:hypothetical protein